MAIAKYKRIVGEALKNSDLFGVPPSLNIGGKSLYTSKLGGLVTILLASSCSILFIQMVISYINKIIFIIEILIVFRILLQRKHKFCIRKWISKWPWYFWNK